MPACIELGGAITCYGLTGDLVTGYDGVVVAIAVVEEGVTELEFVLMPFNTPAAPASTDGSISFGPGTHLVGTDIEPGMYTAENTSGHICRWQRLSGLTGEYDDVIASDINESGQIYVEILPTDVAFSADDQCGTWTRVEQ